MNLTLAAIIAWARSSSTIIGTVTLGGTLWEAIQHQMPWGAAAPVIVGAVVAMAWPEQTGLSAAAQKTVADAVALGQSKTVNPAALAALSTDLVTTAEMFPPGTPVIAVQHTVTPIAPSAVPAMPTAANAA